MNVETLFRAIPGGRRLGRYLLARLSERYAAARACEVARLPRVQVQESHVQGGMLLANRVALLERLPHGGVVAELGVNVGDFSEQIFLKASPQKLYLVDSWDSARYGKEQADRVRSRFAAPIREGRIEILQQMSVPAASHFQEGSCNWIYIDTDHGYECTRDELRAWESKVADDGLIAGHDYTMGNWAKGYKYGVIEAVAEFCVERAWRIRYVTADFMEGCSFAIQRIP